MSRWHLRIGGSCVILGIVSLMAVGDDPVAQKPADPTKRRAEAPTQRVVGPPAQPADMRKAVAEAPTKALVTGASPSPSPDNPKVEPGLVRWHESFETACDAARRSGKPVLLFQMMGKLDDRFC